MRIGLFTLLLLAVVSSVHAQVSQKYIGRTGRSEFLADFATLNNGNRVLAGYAYNNSSTVGSDALIICMDPNDNILWSKEIGTTGTDRFLKVKPTADGGCVTAGYCNASSGVNGAYALVAKFDATGNMLWYKTLKASTSQEVFLDVDVSPTNGHIICSGSYNYVPAGAASMAVDFDASGNILWSKIYDGNLSDGMWNLLVKGNDIIGSGYFQGATLYDGYLLELDESNGNIKWGKSYDYTSTINGITGQWPQQFQMVNNKLYADVYDFDQYGITADQHALIQFDTSGLNPLCLEYKFATNNVAGGIHTLIASPTDIYLMQAGSTPDYQTGTSNAGMTDGTITKIKSLTAASANPLYTRKLANTGAQFWWGSKLIGNKIVAVGGAQGDPLYNIGTHDGFKLEVDTSFPVTSANCAANLTTPQFANPAVTLSAYAPAVSAVSFTNAQVTLTTTAVTLNIALPCVPADTIINKYAAVLARLGCTNTFSVDTATGFNVGDTVLMVQMKGATIDSSNTATFGNVTALNGAGNYEYNIIKAVSGNNITLTYKIKRTYDIPGGKVQFVRVFNAPNYTVTQKHTCLPWTGTKGGVFIMNVAGTLSLNNTIDVTGKGFKGGVSQFLYSPNVVCNGSTFAQGPNIDSSAMKGEGITSVGINKTYGKGNLANGGGGANAHNAGGGGGANAAAGGQGGTSYAPCSVTGVQNGIGGAALTYNNTANKIFLGGGGGAGHANNNTQADGAAGGGIVIITAGTINTGASGKIVANGAIAPNCSSTTQPSPCSDGMGGGGGGGGALLLCNNYANALVVETKGGKGADVSWAPANANEYFGPGGGGGGGFAWFSNAVVPANVTVSSTGGANGVILSNSSAYGAVAGGNGQSLIGLALSYPVIADTFKSNTITINFIDSFIFCPTRKLVNQTTTTTVGITAWSWDFGDGSTSTLQNPIHTFPGTGTYTVKLIAIDSNQCRDSLSKPVVISCNDTVINRYAAVLTRGICDNIFGVDSTQGFFVGDTVLMIQMQGASLDSSNTASFGKVLAYNGAGNWEFNVIKSIVGNNFILKYKLKRQYDIPDGKVQFVRLASYGNYTMNQPHAARAWNGTKGGVFLMKSTGTLTLNSNINVAGKGFLGGQPLNSNAYTCNKTDYFYPSTNNNGAQKGEGIGLISVAKTYGRGRLANGGGGGNDHNAGGGGGSNAGFGGLGGNQYQLGPCATTAQIGGVGGDTLSYSNAINKVFLGGGGGAGHGNDLGDKPGAPGGGILFLIANNVAGNGQNFLADGGAAIQCTSAAPGCQDDGTGGGGGGGVVMAVVSNYTSPVNITAGGGKGANTYVSAGTTQVAPGGGGGGGAIWFSQAAAPANTANAFAGGLNGVLPQFNNDPYGAQPGTGGKILNNLPFTYPAAVDSFKPNVFNVRFGDSVVSCFARKMLDSSATTATGIASWNWNFGGGNISTLRNPTFNFGTYGSYPVKLIVIDSNGCRDSLTKNVILNYVHFANAGADTVTCLGVASMLHASGGVSYSWSPASSLTTPNAAATIANPTVSTQYIVTVTSAIGCVDKDTASISLIPGDAVVATPHDLTNCKGKKVQLSASGVNSYVWTPAAGLSSTSIANPFAVVNGNITYVVTGKDSKGCISFDSVMVTEAPPPVIDAYADADAVSCYNRSIQLHVTGAVSYRWRPGAYVNDSTIAAPMATPPRTTTFTVYGTDAQGCIGSDTITIISYGQSVVYMPNAFTPNGDHLNDDIRPTIFCDFELGKWEVFNRWGQSVYQGYNLNTGWDGSFGGQPAPMGVYMYYVRGKNNKGEVVIYKGNITLLR